MNISMHKIAKNQKKSVRRGLKARNQRDSVMRVLKMLEGKPLKSSSSI